jgi:DNA topoisomerase IB
MNVIKKYIGEFIKSFVAKAATGEVLDLLDGKTIDADFEESQHPRVPGGSSKGGQFTSKGSTGSTVQTNQSPKKTNISGKVDISNYPENAKDIPYELRMQQASHADVTSQMNEDLAKFNLKQAKHTTVAGLLTSEAIETITDNARAELSKYNSYLAGQTNDMCHYFINHMERIFRGVPNIKAEYLDAMMIDSIRKLVFQEIESNRQQFTDHGIRHLVGNIQRQDALATAMQGVKPIAAKRLMAAFIMINHDIGYTTPLIRSGGLRGVMVSGDHKHFSEKILQEQRNIWNENKIFTPEQYDSICAIVDDHDSTVIDPKNILKTTTSLADNLSLFASEKLPGMFAHVEGGKLLLTELGEAAKKDNKEWFNEIQAKLYNQIDKANISGQLKNDLKASVKEISFVTPKFTMGVLAGEITNIEREEGKAVVDIEYNEFDGFLQKMFDMGQSQTKKLLKDYGITDFTKNEYDLGGLLKLRVAGGPKQTISEEHKALREKFGNGTVPAKDYIAARDKGKFNQFLTPYKEGDMKDWRLYLTKDNVGFAIKPDGDMVGVFNNSGVKGAGNEAITLAIAEGAKSCDCIGKHLKLYYERFGFNQTESVKWDDQYAPEGWNYERFGRPNVYFFTYPESETREPSDIRRRFEASQHQGDTRDSEQQRVLDRCDNSNNERGRSSLFYPTEYKYSSRRDGANDNHDGLNWTRDSVIGPFTIDFKPTEAQLEAGNYKKGHTWFKVLNISIENDKGSIRHGTDKNGNSWEVEIPAAYGYIRRTIGSDEDQVDVYLANARKAKVGTYILPKDSDKAFIIDQQDLDTLKFDEHKIILGASDVEEAIETYQKGYNDDSGPFRMLAICEVSLDDLKRWLRDGDTQKPFYTDYNKFYTKQELGVTALDEFNEADHPRGQPENAGEFVSKGGGVSKVRTGLLPKSDKMPKHIASLKIPPAWTNVYYNPDPKADLLVIGKDVKGRDQYVYSEKFKKTNAKAKFARIKELDKKYGTIIKQNNKNLKHLKYGESANCLNLIMQTGIRPGSDTDTQAKVKAYGATTLEGRHVVMKDDTLYLEFIGKKGVALSLPVTDLATAKDLLMRKKRVGDNGRLFKTNGDQLLNYTNQLDGKGFKVKDFRTHLGTSIAIQKVNEMPAPKDEKEYKKYVKLVATEVAKRLGNTPTVALQSYISPVVFQKWRLAA